MKKIVFTLFFFASCAMMHAQQVNSASSSPTVSTQANFIAGTIYVEMYNTAGKQSVTVVKNEFLFTPNPVKDYVYFNEESEVAGIVIFDLNGRKMFESQIKDNAVNLGNLPKGSYIMMTNLDNSKGYKLLKD